MNLRPHTKQMGVSSISSYVTEETINTPSAPSTKIMADSTVSQKRTTKMERKCKRWQLWRRDKTTGEKSSFYNLDKEKSLGTQLKRSTGVTNKKERMRDRQHVQGIDKQMDHMWYWQGTEFHNQPASHQLLKQTDTVSEPAGQLVQPAKM